MEDIEVSTVYAKVDGINTSDSIYNLSVTLVDGQKSNFKIESDLFSKVSIQTECLYEFRVGRYTNQERNVMYVSSVKAVSQLDDPVLKNLVYRKFMKSAPVEYDELKEKIFGYINKISNKVIFDITNTLLKKFQDDFFLYPAAARFHHAYVGGLAYHTLGMLNLVDGFLNNYQAFDRDYIYAGIVLHDIGKVVEFTGIDNVEYGLEGQLLGHLVIGSQEVHNIASKLGYEGLEEVLLLEHMIISHHGQPSFGSAKRPATPEAILLWYIDTLDSKFRVLEEEMANTKPGRFTEPIGVLDKTKIYKHK